MGTQYFSCPGLDLTQHFGVMASSTKTELNPPYTCEQTRDR